jgi:hypothetical protein
MRDEDEIRLIVAEIRECDYLIRFLEKDEEEE